MLICTKAVLSDSGWVNFYVLDTDDNVTEKVTFLGLRLCFSQGLLVYGVDFSDDGYDIVIDSKLYSKRDTVDKCCEFNLLQSSFNEIRRGIGL